MSATILVAACGLISSDSKIDEGIVIAAREKIRREHDLPQAVARLAAVIERLGRKRAA